MAAEDELAIPEVPEAKPDDAEDVSWALSTAEAMWARGDHLEGIKWVRKAAEAASDVENDERALELAKAASELTTLIARRSRASMGDSPGLAGGAPPDFTTSAKVAIWPECMYGAVRATPRKVGVRNCPRWPSFWTRPVSFPVALLSLYTPSVLNGLASKPGTSWLRPRSEVGTFAPVCGTASA